MDTKNTVVLFAGSLHDEALKTSFDGKSAFERSVTWAQTLPNIEKILIATTKERNLRVPADVAHDTRIGIHCETHWTVASLLQFLRSLNSTIIFAFADCPFYDATLTLHLCEKHTRYRAEYTFADGYPIGVAPEIIDSGTLAILASLACDQNEAVQRDSIFSVLKTDINSFEIETEIAPVDMRYLRLTFACNSRRNALQCVRLFMHPLFKEGNSIIEKKLLEQSGVLRTLPAFFNVQIAAACPSECSFCAYPSVCREVSGVSALSRSGNMSLEQFSLFVDSVAAWCEDAVISLSAWGEPLLHPQLDAFVKKVLSYPSLSVLIETTGIAGDNTEFMIASIAHSVSACYTRGDRTSEYKPIYWIVSLDATNQNLYESLHGKQSLEAAEKTAEHLMQLFPHMVWVQFLRVQESESDMEHFYRSWKEKKAPIIIQKYDSFAGALPDKKVADLTPLHRNPCWHMRRDMTVLLDGTVPLCHEDIHCSKELGNVFTESLEEIWKRGESIFHKQLENYYEGLCVHCDEYYTYNF